MKVEPAQEIFAETYGRGEPQVVWTTMVADLETPVSAFLKIAGRPPGFLLESVEGGAVRGRYSIIGLEPDVVWRSNGGIAEINRTARVRHDNFEVCPQPPLEALRSLIAESRIVLPPNLPPMAAGVFGYLGYDMVRLMESLPPANPDTIGIADAVLVRPTLVVVFDAFKDTLTVVTPVRPEPGVSAEAAHARAVARLNGVVDDLDKPLVQEAANGDAGPPNVFPTSNTSPEEFAAMVRRAKEDQLLEALRPVMSRDGAIMICAARHQTAHAVADDDQLLHRRRPFFDQRFEQLREGASVFGNM